MKRSLILLATLAVSGCSNLNVSWSLNASYNTLSQTRTLTEHAPAVEDVKPVAVPPPPLPAGKAS